MANQNVIRTGIDVLKVGIIVTVGAMVAAFLLGIVALFAIGINYMQNGVVIAASALLGIVIVLGIAIFAVGGFALLVGYLLKDDE